MSEVKQHVMEAILGSLMILGVFGNVNVIVAVARKKALRTKGAMLIFVLAISHLVCNLSELKMLLLRVRFRKMKGRDCLVDNAQYSLAAMFQSGLFLSMALDLCFCIIIPIRHMLWPKTRYVLLMCIMPAVFSVAVFIINAFYVTDENAPYCAFMLTLDDGVFELLTSSVVACNVATVAITIVSVLMAIRKSQNMRKHRHTQHFRRGSGMEERRKVFRSTFYMMVIYIVCWMCSSIFFRILLFIFDDEKELVQYIPYMITITLPNFCQAYFVTYLRSHRFRKAYKEHFHWLSCGLLFADVFDKQDTRAAESGSRPDSATNQQAPTEIDGKQQKEKKAARMKSSTII